MKITYLPPRLIFNNKFDTDCVKDAILWGIVLIFGPYLFLMLSLTQESIFHKDHFFNKFETY